MEYLIPIIIGIFLMIVIMVVAKSVRKFDKEEIARMSPQEREKRYSEQTAKQLEAKWGPINPSMVCPHCNEKGKVHTKSVKGKQRIHAGRATAVVLTGESSMLENGLTRKKGITQAYCGNCHNTWDF
jgi:sensor histidine kinase regulating citrate/malate metabolism